MRNLKNFEIGLLLILGVYFLFAATNINPTLGTIYALFTLFSVVFLLVDSKREIPLHKPKENILFSFFVGAIAYIILLLLGSFIIAPTINYISQLLGATTPLLATNPFFNKLTFGLAVPIAETYLFFIVIYDVFASLLNVNIDKKNILNPKLLGLMIVIAFGFMAFHLTAKGISNPAVLGLVFLMAVISLLLVTIFKDGEKANLFHIIANGLAVI